LSPPGRTQSFTSKRQGNAWAARNKGSIARFAQKPRSRYTSLCCYRFTAEIRSQSFGSPPTDRERRLQQASTANHITQLDATQWMQIRGPLRLLLLGDIRAENLLSNMTERKDLPTVA
jgi:hypothetical protein